MSCFLAGAMAALVYDIVKLNQVLTDEGRFPGSIKFLIFFCKSVTLCEFGAGILASLARLLLHALHVYMFTS